LDLRTLKFIVDNQIIKPDPDCDFDGLVPGTEEYLKAEFSFSPEWVGYVKVASFRSMMGREYAPQELKDGKTCSIPAEALKRRAFKMRVVGKKGGLKILTNTVVVNQNGGRE
jgi:hypothetical protein